MYLNELFLASGTGRGLTNENQLEAISGKCYVLSTSEDIRNPQPSDEEIKSVDFFFRRTFDVGTYKILDKIDDKIAGVDVKFIFNKISCEKQDSLKPKLPSTSGSVRQNGYKKEEGCHKRLASKKITFVEERSNKDYSRRDDDRYNASGSRRNDYHGKKKTNK
ncbi:unnamed protein product, partial [Arabidopsis halleri]